jgi:hypothetical protein
MKILRKYENFSKLPSANYYRKHDLMYSALEVQIKASGSD